MKKGTKIPKTAWIEIYDIKEQVKPLGYFPALSIIYGFLERHKLKAKRTINSIYGWHRFDIEGIIVDFWYTTKFQRKYKRQ